jgi:isoamylase
MSVRRSLFAAILGCVLVALPALAAINSPQLGASYDAGQANVNFKIYSSRATRIELWAYSTASGTQMKLLRVMVKGAGDVWTTSVPVTSLVNAGITGTVYYGYRAWGPNWTYVSGWTRGSSLGFISDVDAAGNRFNPNKLLADPYALELSHDPTTATMTDGTIYASGALYRNLDDGSAAPKGIVLVGDTQSIGTKPTRAFKDDIV